MRRLAESAGDLAALEAALRRGSGVRLAVVLGSVATAYLKTVWTDPAGHGVAVLQRLDLRGGRGLGG